MYASEIFCVQGEAMSKIIGNELKNLPWEPKPADCVMPV